MLKFIFYKINVNIPQMRYLLPPELRSYLQSQKLIIQDFKT